MPWPLSQDYNEAIQNPSTAFADAELKQGEAVVNALGLPQPCSGNFADVYAVQSGSRKWAVKCFTRQIPGLQERYVQISKYLQEVKLPFMVEFSFLEKGIRVRGQWYPVLKMQWVEGFALNTFVRDNLDKPQVLQTLGQIWLKLAQRLREANLAHCDLQHGNVLLVPSKAGSLGVKLVDYDGMCVPALELLKSIELGHANFQHPQRLKEGTYGLEIDRFPHLVICTALRALSVGGKALWDKFDTGDNLLFTQKDFATPTKSPLFAELFKLNDAEVKKLAGALMLAAQKPIDEVPLLDELVETKAAVKPQAAAAAVKPAAPIAENVFAAATSSAPAGRRMKYDAKKKSSAGVAIAAGIGAVVLIGGIVAFATMRGSPSSKAEVIVKVHGPQTNGPVSVEARPTVRERTDTKPQTRPETKPEPKSEPKAEPKTEPKSDPKPEPKTEPAAAEQTKRYLSDMAEIEPKVGWGKLGKNGDLGYVANEIGSILVNGKKSPKGLSLHAVTDGHSSVKYRLGKAEKVFVASAAINDTAGTDPRTALTFIVLGDEKILWKSKPVKSIRTIQNCRVDVTGIDLLELRVDCPGDGYAAQAVWLEPFVSRHAQLEVEPKPEPKTEPIANRMPVPDSAAQAVAEKVIKDLFKDDYAKRKPADLLVLAGKLLEQGSETKDDPVARFVLYREAQSLAAHAADSGLALKAADALAKDFAVPAVEMKATTLEKVALAAKTPEPLKALAESALAVVEEALAADDYDSAGKLLKIADSAARKTKNVSLLTAIQKRGKEIASYRQGYEKVKEAVKTLETKPNDPEANLALGQFLCFQKGDWPKGLPLLAQSGDAKLKDLAGKDIAGPKEAAERVEVADAWWVLAEPKKGKTRRHLQDRALIWYEKALPELTGLNKSKVEKRIKLALSERPPKERFEAWVRLVAVLPADKQVQEVAKKLQELNPAFDGKVTPTIEGDVVTGLEFVVEQVTDIAPVQALKGLKALTMKTADTVPSKVADLSPLKGLALTSLSCHRSQVKDLSPLKGMPMTSLSLYWTAGVSDLSPLRGMPLTGLDIQGSAVSDLSPLKGMPLTYLGAAHSQIKDLTPLKGLPLQSLNLYANKFSDLSPLKDMPLKALTVGASNFSDLSPLKAIKTLETIDGKPAKEVLK